MLSLKELKEYLIAKGGYEVLPSHKQLQDLKDLINSMYVVRNENTCNTHIGTSYEGSLSLGDIYDAGKQLHPCSCNVYKGLICDCESRTGTNLCDCDTRTAFCDCENRTYQSTCDCDSRWGCYCEYRTYQSICNCDNRTPTCDCRDRISIDDCSCDGRINCDCLNRTGVCNCHLRSGCTEFTQAPCYCHTRTPSPPDWCECEFRTGVPSCDCNILESCDCENRTSDGECYCDSRTYNCNCENRTYQSTCECDTRTAYCDCENRTPQNLCSCDGRCSCNTEMVFESE